LCFIFSEYTIATMGAPFKQKQLSKIESDMSVISKIKPKMNLPVQRSFSDSGNGRLMMSRGTQVHVESPEPIKLPKEVTMDSNSTLEMVKTAVCLVERHVILANLPKFLLVPLHNVCHFWFESLVCHCIHEDYRVLK
jgi:hypothetical protein